MAYVPDFNYEEVEAAGDYKPAPVGDYKMVVTDSDVRPNKAGTGTVLEVKIEIIDGSQKGKNWRQWFNVINANETAQRIGQGEFKALSVACGLDHKPRDTAELHGKPFLGHVIIEENGQYRNNKCQSYTRITSAGPTPQNPVAQMAGQTIGQPAKKPWEQ